MAVVLMSATLKDAKTTATGRVRNTQSVAGYKVLGSETVANLLTVWSNYATTLDPLTEAQIIGGGITLFPSLPGGIKSAPVAESDVQEGGLLTFSLVGTQYTDGLRIPAFLQSLFAADGQTINIADPAIAAFANIVLGLGAAPNDTPFANRYGDLYAALLSGKKSFRK